MSARGQAAGSGRGGDGVVADQRHRRRVRDRGDVRLSSMAFCGLEKMLVLGEGKRGGGKESK